MTVLDVGCGPGRVTIPVGKQVGGARELDSYGPSNRENFGMYIDI
jgi:ubiquinone/menaquinone biosynthesis C-methylase UbiE